MNKKIFIVYYLLFVITCFAQENKVEKLQQLKTRTGIKATELEKDMLKLEYSDGRVLYKYLADFQPDELNKINYSPTYESTIIDLRSIDTSLFYYKFSFWQEVRVGSNQTTPPVVGDINNNNLPEIYGVMKDYSTDYGNNTIMELNLTGSFDSVYNYDSTGIARAIYDIDKDGLNELLLHRFPPDTNYPGHSWLFFTQVSYYSFASELSFVLYPFRPPEGTQINNNTFGDWDGDEFTDQIFVRHCCPNSIFILEYNSSKNNFDSVFYYDPSKYDLYFSGFAIGDINQNGKTEFFAGSSHGDIVSVENCGDNCYIFNWAGIVETYNAYLYAVTNDLDGNGKPEVWIGGDAFYNGVGITRITIFEASLNNNYQAVGKIDLVGVFSTYASNMQALDVDKDGKDEVMICIDQHVIILKFVGTQNHQIYDPFYIKRNELLLSRRNSVYYGAIMYDITNDGIEDIIIYMDEIKTNIGQRLFTSIYQADFTVGTEHFDPLPGKFNFYQNYPNPFNSSTSVKFEIPERSNVSVKVFNILGKEILTLLEKELSPGSHTIDWEAKDNNGRLLPSGMYFIRFNAANEKNNYVKTHRAVLIK